MPPVVEYRLAALGRKMVESVERLYRRGRNMSPCRIGWMPIMARARKGAQGGEGCIDGFEVFSAGGGGALRSKTKLCKHLRRSGNIPEA